jgi:hypothetical protein
MTKMPKFLSEEQMSAYEDNLNRFMIMFPPKPIDQIERRRSCVVRMQERRKKGK